MISCDCRKCLFGEERKLTSAHIVEILIKEHRINEPIKLDRKSWKNLNNAIRDLIKIRCD